jgi:acyl-CoA hydrolase
VQSVRANTVTAAVDHVSFKKPIKLGEVVTLIATVTRNFNTSLEIYVEVFAAGINGSNPRRSNHAYFTFVALDDIKNEPCTVPPVIPLSEIEQKRFDEAPKRRDFRISFRTDQ